MDIQKKEETNIAKALARRGFEEETQKEDLIIPRAKLLQALSPEVVERPKDYQPGMIINSLTKTILPSEFIPIFKFTNWIRFNPRNPKDPAFNNQFEPGAIIWRSNDPYDMKVISEGAFGANGERPLASKFINFFSYFPGLPMPIIVSFANTSFKAGKQLISLAKFSGGDMFSRKYKLNSKQSKNALGTFFVLNVEPGEAVSGDDYKHAESLWEEFHQKDIQVHEESEETTE